MKRPQVLIITQNTGYKNWLTETLSNQFHPLCIQPHIPLLKKITAKPVAVLYAPGHGGLSFIQTITSIFDTIPLILLSRDPAPNEVVIAFRQGISDYLIMPTPEDIMDSLYRFIPPMQEENFFQQMLKKTDQFAGLFCEQILTGNRKTLLEEGSFKLGVLQHPIQIDLPSPAVDKLDIPINLKDIPVLNVQLLGSFSAKFQGKELPIIRSRKARGVLAYLLYQHHKQVPRHTLMNLFWKRVSEESARNSLNVALHGIRKAFLSLDPNLEPITFKNGTYSINPEWGIEVDAVSMLQAWGQARSVEQHRGLDAAIESYRKAAKCYRGDFLEEDSYNYWVVEERENMRETFLFILERLSQYQLKQEAYETALVLNRKILKMDACRESVHKHTMFCLFKLGKRNLALKQYQKCCLILKDELNVSPSQETQNLFEEIKFN